MSPAAMCNIKAASSKPPIWSPPTAGSSISPMPIRSIPSSASPELSSSNTPIGEYSRDLRQSAADRRDLRARLCRRPRCRRHHAERCKVTPSTARLTPARSSGNNSARSASRRLRTANTVQADRTAMPSAGFFSISGRTNFALQEEVTPLPERFHFRIEVRCRPIERKPPSCRPIRCPGRFRQRLGQFQRQSDGCQRRQPDGRARRHHQPYRRKRRHRRGSDGEVRRHHRRDRRRIFQEIALGDTFNQILSDGSDSPRPFQSHDRA